MGIKEADQIIKKEDRISMLKSIVGDFAYEGRIPQEYIGDQEKIKSLVVLYRKKDVTPSVINSAITDISFKEVLDKVERDNSYKGRVLLRDIKEIDLGKIVVSVDELLMKVPLSYDFIFKLPKCSKDIKDLALSYNIEIKTADADLVKFYGEQSSASRLADLAYGKGHIKEGDFLLRVSNKGYVGKYGLIKLKDVDPLYIWKVVIGIYSGLGVITRQENPTYLRSVSEFSYDVYLGSERVRSFSESTEDNQYVSHQQFGLDAFELSPTDRIFRKTETFFDFANGVLKNLLSKENFKGNKNAESLTESKRMLSNGAYWFYESLKVRADHVRVIYMTTAFDSLLGLKGDDSKENKARLVSASLSKDSLEAERIQKTITELYALRNRIVHGSHKIYSLEQYSDYDENPDRARIFVSLSILKKFISYKIRFVQAGFLRASSLSNPSPSSITQR